MGFSERFLSSEIKNQRLQPFCLPSEKGAYPDSPRGSKNQFSIQESEETQSRLKGPLPQEGNPQCSKDQENTGTIESLEFYYQLCDIENTLLNLLNKLNNV